MLYRSFFCSSPSNSSIFWYKCLLSTRSDRSSDKPILILVNPGPKKASPYQLILIFMFAWISRDFVGGLSFFSFLFFELFGSGNPSLKANANWFKLILISHWGQLLHKGSWIWESDQS